MSNSFVSAVALGLAVILALTPAGSAWAGSLPPDASRAETTAASSAESPDQVSAQKNQKAAEETASAAKRDTAAQEALPEAKDLTAAAVTDETGETAGTTAAQPESHAEAKKAARIRQASKSAKVSNQKQAAGSAFTPQGTEAGTTTLSDGEYSSDKYTFSFFGSSHGASFKCSKLLVKNGKTYAVLEASSAGYTHIYMGTLPSKTLTDSTGVNLYDPSTGKTGSGVYALKEKKAEVPVVINQKMNFAGRTTSMSEPYWISYQYKLTIDEPKAYTVTLAAADAESGEAVSGAVFTLTDETAGKEITASAGKYAVQADHKYKITAMADGYQQGTAEFTPSADGMQTVTMTKSQVDADTKYALTVQVTGETGEQIAAPTITVMSGTETVTPEEGRYLLQAGKVYQIKVSAEGYQEAEKSVQLFADSTEKIQLERTICSLTVSVQDRDTGEEIPGASVTVADESGKQITAEDGKWQAAYGSKVTVAASAAGYLSEDGVSKVSQTVTVTGDTSVSLKMVKHLVRIRIRAAAKKTGKTLKKAKITVENAQTGAAVSGRNKVWNLQVGSSYRITAKCKGYQKVQKTITVKKADTVVLKLKKSRGKKQNSGLKKNQVVDNGTYSVKFKDAPNYMFNVTAVKLHVKDGVYTADVTLGGTGYDYVYPGTAAAAKKAGKKAWSRYRVGADGKYVYTIRVPYLDKEFILASRSAKYAKDPAMKDQAWRDGLGDGAHGSHKIIIYSMTTKGKSLPVHEGTAETSDYSEETDADQETSTEKTKASSTNGTTSRKDNSTGLADGEYSPDSFNWSGGSGRVSIGCDKVIVKNGKTYARITFSSTYYQYVKSNGEKITDHTTSGRSSAFVIPVKLNQNNTIYALTTRMSSAHEIQYTIYVGLAAANASVAESGTADGESAAATKGNVTDQYEQLDAEAPEITGLNYAGETKVTFTDKLRIYRYEGGYTLIEVDVRKGTPLESAASGETQRADSAAAETTAANASTETTVTETTAAAASDEEQTSEGESTSQQRQDLYKNPVIKYLVVPEKAEIPAGMDRQLIIVQQPADSIAVTSASALTMLDTLGLTDSISGVGLAEDEITSDDVKAKMQGTDSSIRNVGTYDNPDYRTFILDKTNLLLESSAILPKSADDTAFYELGSRCVQMNVPMVAFRAEEEANDLAKAEWLKVLGALTGHEQEAEKAYQKVVSSASEADKQAACQAIGIKYQTGMETAESSTSES